MSSEPGSFVWHTTFPSADQRQNDAAQCTVEIEVPRLKRSTGFGRDTNNCILCTGICVNNVEKHCPWA